MSDLRRRPANPYVQSGPKVNADRQRLILAKERGAGAQFGVFTRLSGPGWLQSAITLGGGSLGGALYLGVLCGYSLIWIQLMAMIMGVIMLSAISYVTLSTGERPFWAINRHISPVLGWSWAIATLLANIVWCLPQFALGTAAVQQNLIPQLAGTEGKAVICAALLFIALLVIWFYESGAGGVKIFEIILKIMVAVVVISFFGVVVKLAMSADAGVPWGEVFAGFIPDFSLLSRPADGFTDFITATGEKGWYWADKILAEQRSVMVTAAATAVGINMTFLLPYSMLKKGWDDHFRGLAIFDLSTGLFIPYVLATSCVVIASASQFHTKYDPTLLTEPNVAIASADRPTGRIVGGYKKMMGERLKQVLGDEKFTLVEEAEERHQDFVKNQKKTLGDLKFKAALENDPKLAGLGPMVASINSNIPEAERKIGAMLIRRDAFDLARALSPFTGETFAQLVFGIGVLGMALSTIIILMLISGFTFCEILNRPGHRSTHFLGCLVAGLGVLGPFVWSGKTQFWLAVPTSVFGMCLLPIAYLTFFLMMNSRSLLGDALPTGLRRLKWNTLMGIALAASCVGAGWSIWSRPQVIFGMPVRWIGIAIIALIVIGALAVPGKGRSPAASNGSAD
ncbi:MAG: divalent metal cation transporter [Phycisphaerae bacterium]|nr:divalent metal cation transporter [Phycisphaerae bacterium]